jgi:hypothetical protein
VTQKRTIVLAMGLAGLLMWAPKPALSGTLPGSPFSDLTIGTGIELHMFEEPVGMVNGKPSFATATIDWETPNAIGPFLLDCAPLNGIPTCMFRDDMEDATAGSVVVTGCSPRSCETRSDLVLFLPSDQLSSRSRSFQFYSDPDPDQKSLDRDIPGNLPGLGVLSIAEEATDGLAQYLAPANNSKGSPKNHIVIHSDCSDCVPEPGFGPAVPLVAVLAVSVRLFRFRAFRWKP